MAPLTLFFALACGAQAEQTAQPPETAAFPLADSTRSIDALEQTVLALSDDDLTKAKAAASELIGACPYNGASLQLMGSLVEHVPQDSATRAGVDTMARVIQRLGLDAGTHSVAEMSARLEGVMPAVEALTPEQSSLIEAAGTELGLYLGEAAWPPKPSFLGWRDQLRAEGHTELADMIDLQTRQRC